MARAGQSLRIVETVVSTLLVTIGVLGLLGRANMLVDHLNVAASSPLLQLWPLALVILGLMQIAVDKAQKLSGRK